MFSVTLLLLIGCSRNLSVFAADCVAGQIEPTDCSGRYVFVINKWPNDNKLGNNLISLTNALYLAQKTSSELVVPPYPHFTKTSWDFRTDTMADDGIRRTAVRSPSAFFYHESALYNWSFSNFAQRELMLNEVLPVLRFIPRHISQTVIVHVRGADVFSEHPHEGYTQPPFAFYKVVLALPKLANLHIILCTEDHRNPVVDLLLKEYSSRLRLLTDYKEGVQTILGAKHLVLARSTFGEYLGKMASRLESVYFPFCYEHLRNGADWRDPYQLWTHYAYCCDYGDNYIPTNGWSASLENLQLMANFTVDKVELYYVSAPGNMKKSSGRNSVFT